MFLIEHKMNIHVKIQFSNIFQKIKPKFKRYKNNFFDRFYNFFLVFKKSDAISPKKAS